MNWLTFKITLAIRLSLQVYTEPNYVIWANKWLNNEDRFADDAADAADAAAAAADAAAAAAYDAAAAAYDAAYDAAADAADAAERSIKHSISAGAKLEKTINFLS